MTGYSEKLLSDKLGVKPHSRICIIHAPAYYEKLLSPLDEVTIHHVPEADEYFLQLFVTDKNTLHRELPKILSSLAPYGMLWISWPKRTSSLSTDLTENMIRDIGLSHSIVDIKVAAIDDDWSGLKFVYRVKDRIK